MGRFTGLIGLAIMVGLAYAFSNNRKRINWRTVGTGLALQLLFAVIVLKWTPGQHAIAAAGKGAEKLLSYAFAGSSFVFGAIGLPASKAPHGFMFAFQVLPALIFIAAFFSILYHLGVMQFIIRIAALVMEKLMGVSGVESLNVAASIVMGQTEAPLTIRPFLPRVTQSELMVIMTAPGTFTVAKMFVPETEVPESAGKELPKHDEDRASNVLEATAKGTTDGLHLALNVCAMLISFIALIALINGVMGSVHNVNHMHWFPASLETIFGWVFAPVAFIIGVPWHDCTAVGNLLGTRMVLNELVAFTMLGPQQATLDPRSFTIATFALCGFANFSSIGIQIGGLSALAPNRRGDLARLGFKAMIAGTMANLMSACIVGVLL